jgi:hypothetical protein
MAKQGSSAGGAKSAACCDQSTGGGSAGIEIVGFPQKLYTRTFGDPDTLFVPLLEAAREANTTFHPRQLEKNSQKTLRTDRGDNFAGLRAILYLRIDYQRC